MEFVVVLNDDSWHSLCNSCIHFVIMLQYLAFRRRMHSIILVNCFSTDVCYFNSAGVSGSDNLRLMSVHITIRHGDRSPLHSVPDIVNKPFNCHMSPLHSNQTSTLFDFLRRMEEVGHYRQGNGSYAGYSLYPAKGICELGSLTPTGVEQQIISGAFLRKAYITKHKLLVSDDENFSEQVCSLALYWLFCYMLS